MALRLSGSGRVAFCSEFVVLDFCFSGPLLVLEFCSVEFFEETSSNLWSWKCPPEFCQLAAYSVAMFFWEHVYSVGRANGIKGLVQVGA